CAGGDVGVRVIQGHDEAECDLVVCLVIEEATAPCVLERPALRVDHSPGLMFLGGNVPQLLDAKPENLRAAFLAESEHLRQPLGEMATRTLSEERVAGVELHARLVIGTVTAIAGYAQVPGGDALYRPIVVEQDFRRGKAGEYL